MWQELLTALALLLIIEGVFPFIAPAVFRQAMLNIARQHEQALRVGGLSSMIIGVILLYIVR